MIDENAIPQQLTIDEATVPSSRARQSAALAVAAHAAMVLGALWLFVIALQLIKTGANGLRPILDGASVDGVLGHLGFGWLGSYAVMSGSPVAAVSMSLFAGGAISDLEAFAMI